MTMSGQTKLIFVATTVVLALSFACNRQASTVLIDSNDIGGVVTSTNGPEAGVWVIAETLDLPTKFARIVVTNEQGQYVLPDLPNATYRVFVRGYGLIDSPDVSATPGLQVNLTATLAPNETAAAQLYPAGWWFSMMTLPEDPQEKLEFHQIARGCLNCHELGNKETREIGPALASQVSSSLDAWNKRVGFGPFGGSMIGAFKRLGPHQKHFADWTDRIANGEAPSKVPPRPSGVERNLVLTLWDWGTPLDGRADAVASDRRHSSVNANGPIYGGSQMTDAINILEPNTHTTSIVKVPSLGPVIDSPAISPAWETSIWKRAAGPRSIEMDSEGQVWLTLRTRNPRQQPSWCSGAGANAFGKYLPLTSGDRQVATYDPTNQEFNIIDTCFHTDHSEFSKDDFIYYGTTDSIGWVDVQTWNSTHDAEESQGWCPAVIDTNGDGKITEGWTEPSTPVDPTKDHRIMFGCYAIGVNQTDGSVWCSSTDATDRQLVRIEKGSKPPQTCSAEVYTPPPGQTIPELIGTGGLTIDADGIVYQSWRVSGHLTAFDRRKCKSGQTPSADGQNCPEGWTIYRNDEPSYVNSLYHATEPYLNHMDTVNVLGLGEDSPMYGSINTDSFEVLSSETKSFVTLRVPYPLGFFPRSASVRVDDPQDGWKGRGLWSNFSTYTTWHLEGGKGTLPKIVKFQMRQDPLDK